jgi:predicted O-methyltransferase YrrM
MNLIKLVKKNVSRIRHSTIVSKFLDYENRKKAYVIKKYRYKNGLPTIELLELLSEFKETIEPYSFLDGAASLIDIAILKSLARKIPDCNYLEIGSLRGESIANVATVAKECTSISLSPDEMGKLGFSEDLIRFSNYFSNGLKNVTHIAHSSLTFDFTQLEKKFDLVFIDGDHYDESVKIDTQNAFNILRDENSIIVWHDYGFSAGNIRWSVLAGILDGTPKNKRNKLFHISNSMCAIYFNRSFNSLYTVQPEIPNKCFSIRISLEKESKQNENRK